MKIIGHRGARGLAAENTLAGIAKAVALGVAGIEIDVHLLKDGYFAVHHNFLFSSKGPALKDMNFEDLRSVSAQNIATRIPLLFEVFETLRLLHEIELYIEVKTDPRRADLSSNPEDVVEALLLKLDTYLMIERVTILAFDWRVLSLLAARAPNIKRGYLSASETYFKDSPWLDGLYHEDPTMAVAGAGGTLWLPHYGILTQEQAKSAHRRKVEVVPWTVNEAQDAQRLKAWGVDGIITDYPDRFLMGCHTQAKCY